MIRGYCPRNLDKILFFVGKRDLVIHSQNDSPDRRFRGRIRVNAFRLKTYLMEHIPKCGDCRVKYKRFLERQRTDNQSREDINKEYLSIPLG